MMFPSVIFSNAYRLLGRRADHLTVDKLHIFPDDGYKLQYMSDSKGSEWSQIKLKTNQ